MRVVVSVICPTKTLSVKVSTRPVVVSMLVSGRRVLNQAVTDNSVEWTQAGIRVWFFNRNNIPSDITNDKPDPESWGTPTANFRGDTCDPYKFFTENFNIFTNTFCGDWSGADSVWNSAGYAGQTESCASKTGYATCSDYVLNKGSAFSEAYWEVSLRS